jgi:hypothetical protein
VIFSQLPPVDCDIGLGFYDTATAGRMLYLVSQTQVSAQLSTLASPELRFTNALRRYPTLESRTR